MKKVLYLGLVMVLCFFMIGCSNSNAFKVGETEFSNEEVDKVKSILTATQSYTDADYLSEFKESKDNDDKVKDEVVSYMIDNEVVYQQAQKEKIKVTDDEVNQKYSQIEKMLDTNQEYKKLLDDAGVDEDYLKETIKKDLAVQKYRENFEQDLKVTDKEVEKYYKEHKDEFKEESVEAYHILVSTLNDNNKTVDDSKKEELKSIAESFVKYPKYPPFLPELLSSEFSFAIFSKSPPFFISLSKDSALDFNFSFLESSSVLLLSFKVDTNI